MCHFLISPDSTYDRLSNHAIAAGTGQKAFTESVKVLTRLSKNKSCRCANHCIILNSITAVKLAVSLTAEQHAC